MPGPNCFLFLGVPLAYTGPGAELELIPYFLGLLAWAGMALGAVFLRPIAALLRCLRRAQGDPKDEQKNEPMTANVSESPSEGSQDKP